VLDAALAVSAAAIAATWLESTSRPVAEAETLAVACLRDRPRFLRGFELPAPTADEIGAMLGFRASQKRIEKAKKLQTYRRRCLGRS
jgi:hypothetical protein